MFEFLIIVCTFDILSFSAALIKRHAIKFIITKPFLEMTDAIKIFYQINSKRKCDCLLIPLHVNNIEEEGKDQESIQSSTTPDPGYQWESNKLTIRHHK